MKEWEGEGEGGGWMGVEEVGHSSVSLEIQSKAGRVCWKAGSSGDTISVNKIREHRYTQHYREGITNHR